MGLIKATRSGPVILYLVCVSRLLCFMLLSCWWLLLRSSMALFLCMCLTRVLFSAHSMNGWPQWMLTRLRVGHAEPIPHPVQPNTTCSVPRISTHAYAPESPILYHSCTGGHRPTTRAYRPGAEPVWRRANRRILNADPN